MSEAQWNAIVQRNFNAHTAEAKARSLKIIEQRE